MFTQEDWIMVTTSYITPCVYISMEYNKAKNKIDAYWDTPSPKAKWKYYAGFNTRNPMFEDELKDLETLYTKELEEMEQSMKYHMPTVFHVMEQLINQYKDKELLKEKLEVLKNKKLVKELQDYERIPTCC